MFTSRLPVSTSVRRPKPPRDGSTSVHRPSHIPTTVRKANLFTPQTKRPLSMGASTASKSVFGTSSKFRPTKPAPDRDEQIQMFNNLADYLKTNAPHLPQLDPKKFFSSVSTTESTRIFEFLISRKLPEFKITRLEVDVPEVLTQLEYPYIRSVTKSSLVSVTTRQAVVGLLSIFNWLIEFNNHTYVYTGSGDDADILEYILIHNDDEALSAKWDQMNPEIDLQPYIEELQKLDDEQQHLQQQLDRKEEEKDQLQVLVDDIKKLEDYDRDAENYVKEKKLEENRLVSDVEAQMLKIGELRGYHEQLLFQNESHRVSSVEAKRIHEEYSELVAKKDELDRQRDDARQTLEQYKHRVNLDKKRRAIEDLKKEADSLTRELEPASLKEIASLREEKELIIEQHRRDSSRLSHEMMCIENDISKWNDESRSFKENLEKEFNLEKEALLRDEQHFKENAELNYQLLSSVLNENLRKARVIEENFRKKAEHERAMRNRAEENRDISRKVSKMIRKRLVK